MGMKWPVLKWLNALGESVLYPKFLSMTSMLGGVMISII